MNTFNRLFVTVAALAMIAGGVLVLLVVSETVSPRFLPGNTFSPQFTSMAAHTGADLWEDVGIAIGLIVVGALLLALEVRQLVRSSTPGMVLLSSSEEGVVRLSLDSIAELARRTGSGSRGVRNMRCYVRVTSAGLSIRCMVGLRMGANVPEASAEIQKNVREVVERLTSLTVRDVPVRARYLRGGDQPLLAR